MALLILTTDLIEISFEKKLNASDEQQKEYLDLKNLILEGLFLYEKKSYYFWLIVEHINRKSEVCLKKVLRFNTAGQKYGGQQGG